MLGQAILWTMFLCAAIAALACPVALAMEAWRIQIGRKAVRRDK